MFGGQGDFIYTLKWICHAVTGDHIGTHAPIKKTAQLQWTKFIVNKDNDQSSGILIIGAQKEFLRSKENVTGMGGKKRSVVG